MKTKKQIIAEAKKVLTNIKRYDADEYEDEETFLADEGFLDALLWVLDLTREDLDPFIPRSFIGVTSKVKLKAISEYFNQKEEPKQNPVFLGEIPILDKEEVNV